MAACSRSATMPSTPRDARARHPADRSAGGQSLSVRGDGREGRRLRRLHREHRHRRPGDDPRRRQEPRRRRRGRRAERLRRVLAELDAARRRDHAGAAPQARRQGLCAHRRLRRGDLQLVRRSSSTIRRRPIAPSAASSPRRCATARTRTRRRRSTARPSCAPASPPRASCRASSSPTTTSTTPTRPSNASREFDPARTAACVIIKHANPCGVAEGASLLDAYRKALACDPVSAFGGIVALNRPLDAEAARAITEIFTEVIIAPDASEEAIAIVGAKKNLRLLLAGGLPDPRAGGPDGEIGRRRLAGAVARQRRRRRHGR